VEILSKETASVGWHPPPKSTPQEDFLDCFMSGEVDCAAYSASDPLLLFFKLRFACLLAEVGKYQKAVDKVDKPYQDALKSPKKASQVTNADKERLEKK